MLDRSVTAGVAWPLGSYALAALVLVLGLAGPAAAAGYGDCTVTGQKGAYHIQPAIPGQLTVEVALPAPGWYNGDTPSTIKDGFEYCMAANIAYRAGLDKVVLRNVSWPQLIGGVTQNFDLALSEASITEARKKVVDFSVPYYESNIALLVRKGTKVDAESVKNFSIGVHQGTTEVDFVKNELKPNKPVRVYPTVPGMMAALVAGQIDAVADDTAYVLAYSVKSNGTLVVPVQYHTGETYGAVYPKGSVNEATLNQIIQSLKDDGTLKKLSAQYLAVAFGSDPDAVPFLKP